MFLGRPHNKTSLILRILWNVFEWNQKHFIDADGEKHFTKHVFFTEPWSIYYIKQNHICSSCNVSWFIQGIIAWNVCTGSVIVKRIFKTMGPYTISPFTVFGHQIECGEYIWNARSNYMENASKLFSKVSSAQSFKVNIKYYTLRKS